MNDADIAGLVRDGMIVVLKIGGPLLAVALVSGLLVALIQAVTQINEATLSFIPKLLVIGVTLVLLGPFMFATLSSYTMMLFDRMIAVGALVTPDATALLADMPAWSFAFMLVLARFGAAMALLPGLGEATVPAMVRVGLALGVTILLVPVIFPQPPPMPEAGLTAAGMVAAEVVTGLWLGWLSRLICLALPIAAQFIAYLLGISTVLQPDAELGAQSTALSTMFEVASPVVILVSGLYTLPLAALAGSYRLIPAGKLLPVADSTATSVAAVGQAFGLGLRLASPFVLAAVIWHVAIGLIARLVPRLQIYFVSLPGQIAGGLILLASLFGIILAAWQDAARDALAALPGN